MKGKISSIETMGLVDGPGVRFVVFMQGCPLRCLYCHNPETWNINDFNEEYTPLELINKVLKYKPYFKNNGGITFSGGEPLMQKEFLLKCLKLCKENNIHTCIDTAGSIPNCEEILNLTNLVILDIKATNNEMFKKITSSSIDNLHKFIDSCNKLDKHVWIRSVIVPNINDTKEYIDELRKIIKTIKNVDKVELLPYHSIGVHKYEELKIKYPLTQTMDMNKETCKELENILKEGLN